MDGYIQQNVSIQAMPENCTKSGWLGASVGGLYPAKDNGAYKDIMFEWFLAKNYVHKLKISVLIKNQL